MMNNKFLIFKGKYLKKHIPQKKIKELQETVEIFYNLFVILHTIKAIFNPSMTSFNKLMKCKATENKS